MEQCTLKIVNNHLNMNFYSYLETSGGQSSHLYFNVVHFFSKPVRTIHLWQVKTVVFLQLCLIARIYKKKFTQTNGFSRLASESAISLNDLPIAFKYFEKHFFFQIAFLNKTVVPVLYIFYGRNCCCTLIS
jgi:hypothetical protein